MERRTFLNSPVLDEDMQDIYARGPDWQKLRGKTVLLTGATGMLASYVAFFLVYLNEEHAMGMRLLFHVRSEERARARFGEYADAPYISFVQHDLREPWQLEGAVDFIIHAASLANPAYYKTMPVEVAEPNVLGTYHLLRLAREKGTQSFLFFSSGDVYGKMQEGAGEIHEADVGAADPLDLLSCYGGSKRMGETWCRLFSGEYGVNAKIARIAHTYAPTMDIESDPRVFSSFMKCVAAGTDIVMHSDGSACRPFCYIADAVSAFFLILFEGAAGEAYNVSNDRAFLSIRELAEILVKLRPELGLKVILKERPKGAAYLENNFNKANRPSADKLRAIGWQCRFDAAAGFARVWRYLRDVQTSCQASGKRVE